MGCCDFSKAELDKDSLLEDAEVREEPIAASTARVSLAPGDETGGRLNSVDVPPPTVYYVIVGFGPAAIMNHTTLRGAPWGVARIGNLPVMHIGFRNPWPHYVTHGMGQVPFLLTMPGFNVQPNAAGRTLDGGLHSRDFGDAINVQYARLRNLYAIAERRAWVAWVQSSGNQQSVPNIHDYYPENGPSVAGQPIAPLPAGAPAGAPTYLLNGPGTQLHQMIVNHVAQANARNDWPQPANEHYRIIVVGLNQAREPQLETIYAKYIDFCTGPGRPNVGVPAGATAATKQALYEARTSPWLATEVWDQALRTRRVLNGVDAIANSVLWANGERVCVTAGGGVGLNVAEKARNHNCYLDWFARNSLRGTFANPRNHTFLLSPVLNQGAMEVGELDGLAPFHAQRAVYIPKPPVMTQRFGHGAVLANVEPGPINRVSVTLTAYVPANGPNAGVAVLAVILDNNQALNPPAVPPAVNPLGGSLLINDPNSPIPGQVWDCSAAYLAPPNNVNGPSVEYDRLVVPNGQGSNALGQPAKFTEIGAVQAINLNGRMVALENPDRRVRMLGAACQVYPRFGPGRWNWRQPVAGAGLGVAGAARWNHWHYHAKLPVSAVPDGFILSGSNIATANHYFVTHPNNNINTMTLDEITAALPAALPGRQPVEWPVIAQVIVDCRNRANGYASYLDLPAVPAQPAQPGPAGQPMHPAQPAQAIRPGLMTIVNRGQGQLQAVQPANRPAVNDAVVLGLGDPGPFEPLTVAEAVPFQAIFRFSY